MKSYRIILILEERIKDIQYSKFSSEGHARAYTEGCRDGLEEGHQEDIRQVILAVDERTTEQIEQHYNPTEKENK